MDEDKRGKSLAFWLVLFFLIVILLGGFVGKRLVQIVRASIDTEPSAEIQANIGKEANEKKPFSSQVLDQIAPLELEGGYPYPSPTYTQPPTRTEAAIPTETETLSPTEIPTTEVNITGGETEFPTNTATAIPTATVTRTPPKPPTVGPGGNPDNYVGAGVVFGLIGLVCLSLYFWNLAQIKREQ